MDGFVGGWGVGGCLVRNKYASHNTGDVELEDSNDQAKKEMLSLESYRLCHCCP